MKNRYSIGLKAITVVVGLLLLLVAPVLGSAQGLRGGATEGVFRTEGSPPEGLVVTAPGSMTPQVSSEIRVQVTDHDGMGDVEEVRVALYYTVPPVGAPPASGDPKTAAIITWRRDGDTTLDAGGSSTWQLGNVSVPDSSQTTGEWVFPITPGKAAVANIIGQSRWRAHARVVSGGHVIEGFHDGAIDMNWYGEIQVQTNKVDWGEVDQGSGFGANVNKVSGIQVVYVSNGGHKGQIQAATSWSNVATLDPSGACSEPNRFALRANSEDKFNQSELVSGNPVTIYTSHPGASPHGNTGENGNTVSTHTLWLKIAERFAKGEYRGSITYLIVEG